MSLSTVSDLLQEGVALHRSGAIAGATARYAEVLRIEPDNADAHYFLGMMSCQSNRFAEGAEFARKSLTREPHHAPAHVLLGRALSALGQRKDALTSFERALALASSLAEAHSHRADLLRELDRNAEAVDGYNRALALAPDVAEDWFSRGVALMAIGHYSDAVASFDRVLALKHGLEEAHLWRARALSKLPEHDQTLEAADTLLAITPDVAEAWLIRGNALVKLNRPNEASAALDKALELKPDFAEARVSQGIALCLLKRLEEALTAFDRALALHPDLAEAWLGRGNTLLDLRRYSDALSACNRALALRPDFADAWFGRGNALLPIKRYDEALAAYDRSLALRTDFAEALLGRGSVLFELRRYRDAVITCDKALIKKPGLNYAASIRLHAKQLTCDWSNVEAEEAELLSAVRGRNPSTYPFTLLSVPSSSADQLQCAKSFIGDLPPVPAIWRAKNHNHERVRLAYLSGDFRDHATAALLAGLFEHHDRSRFEVTAISFGPNQPSPIRQRIQRASERFIDVHDNTDQEIADLIHTLEIDIVVDLMGLAGDSRLNILARRPAPIQVGYLGYIGTMGADFIDYIIADEIGLPFDQQPFFTEKIVHLPGCFLVTDDRQEIATPTPSRLEAGLPSEGFVFCCFNNSYKLAKPVFEVWMRLLGAVPGSVLWLVETNPEMVVHLRREAQGCGIAPDRIIFGPRVPLPQHLARQRLAGLFLDTTPYNAGATGIAALWSGVPLVTVLGKTFVGRMAASMLHAAGLPELVTDRLDDYGLLALKLAQDPDLLSGIRQKLHHNVGVTPLFNTKDFARNIEDAYAMMWRRHRRSEPPLSFSVGPSSVSLRAARATGH
jgi:protein O-GlcNAc transferase